MKAPLDQGSHPRVRPGLAVLAASILLAVPAIPAAQDAGGDPAAPPAPVAGEASPAPEAAPTPEAAPAPEEAPAPEAPVPPSGAGGADLGITFGVANPPTPEEEAILASLEEDFKAYKETADEFKKVINHIIKVEYEKRKIAIEREFADQISEEERLEDEARISAIEYFEAFIAKYPSNPTYTPDAMFRLSELYYEQSYVDYDDAMDVYNQQNELFKAGKIPEKPIEPEREYSKTIDLYTTLITKFPDYKNMDGVYYLLGYCFNEMGEFDAALYAWLGLVCSNLEPYEAGKGLSKEGGSEAEGEGDHPSSTAGTVDSAGNTVAGEMFTAPPSDRYGGCKPVAEGTRFLTETWLRIGEYHFDFDYTPAGLQNAISAYRMATTDDTSTYYDLALYKLAWSFWRNGNYTEAIDEFVAVVSYSDRKAAETGKGGSELRPESVQYIALSFWENDWNGDNVDDPETGLQKLKNQAYIDQNLPWLSEVYLQLGQTYMDDNQNQKAIEVYKSYLEHAEWANALEAPEVVQKIIQAYEAEKDEESKIAMIAELAKYGPDSEWAKENVDHPQTVLQVADAAEQALVATALKHHETAQNYKATGQAKTKPAEQAEWIAAAKEQYGLAAESYRKYLTLYPNSPQAYEMTYNLAEALFWSDNYTAAAASYLEVRDSLQDNTYQKDAAYMLVKTLEMLQQTDKTLVVRTEPPEAVDGPGGKAVPELEVPQVLSDLIDAQAAYLKLFPEDKEQAPVFAYLAAKTNFDYGHWAEASVQFQEIYDLYCKSDIIALYSWQNMTFMAGQQGNEAESERLAVLQQDRQCAPSTIPPEELAAAQDLIAKVGTDALAVIEGIEAKKIMETYAKAEETGDPALYEEAAGGLLKLYQKNPKSEEADGILWNAALSYEKCGKPLSALGVAEKLVSEHPESPFMGDALFKLAYNAFNSFEYEKSLQNFKLIADEARFKDSPHREAAVQNTALILENQQKYQVAADYWKKYAAMTKDKALALEASWKAAECWVKAKKWETVEKEMGAFASQFASNKDAQIKVVHARWYVSLSFRERKKQGDFEKSLNAVIEAFKKIKPSDTMSDQDKIDYGKAADYASEAKFIQVEKKLPEFEKYKLNVDASAEKLSAVLTKDLPGMRSDLETQYAEVLGFASPEWIVAAQFRIGYLWEIHSKILLNAPIPKAIAKLPADIRADAEQQYMDKINSLVFPIEDGAKAQYAKALELSKGAGVMNTWTEQTLERLNAYDPDNYPLYKKGKVGTIELQHSLPGLDMTVPGAAAEGQP